jgi:hypothetical protein
MPTTVLLLSKINGIGGTIDSKLPLHCHSQPLKPGTFLMSHNNPHDNIFLRHLSIYLLDKYFRLSHLYQNRHVPMPLGLNEITDATGKIIPSAMISEFVYGFEVSSAYNEHQDWNNVSDAFARFGFIEMNCDLYSGFQGEDGSVSHNFFSQSELFPDEKQVVEVTKNLASVYRRESTARWMRIDFAPDSFPFRMEIFLKQFEIEKDTLKKLLSPTEFTFLKEYCAILQNKNPGIDINPLVKEIRQNEVSAVLATQVILEKRISKLSYEYLEPGKVTSTDNTLFKTVDNKVAVKSATSELAKITLKK